MLALIKLWITFSILMYIKCVIFVQHFEMWGRCLMNFRYYYYTYIFVNYSFFFYFFGLELCNLIELM